MKFSIRLYLFVVNTGRKKKSEIAAELATAAATSSSGANEGVLQAKGTYVYT